MALRASSPKAAAQRALVPSLAERGITGGSVYDALIALTLAEAGVALVSADPRAMRTYELYGVDVRPLAPV